MIRKDGSTHQKYARPVSRKRIEEQFVQTVINSQTFLEYKVQDILSAAGILAIRSEGSHSAEGNQNGGGRFEDNR